nr:hypothetical protein [uncultured Clostridium sp.]
MKKVISFFIVSVVIVAISFGIYNLDDKYKLNIVYDDIQWTINNKDCLNAVSFDFDNDGNIYVAYDNSVERINEDNKVERLFSNDALKIYDIVVYKNYLIISSGNSIIKYDLDNGTFSDIVNNIPNNGINKEIKLLVKGDVLYASIGSNTNSGVVDSPDGKVDIPSFHWTLSGRKYGNSGTSGFCNYSESVQEDSTINEGKFSNASIISCNLMDDEIATYATGIRNVKGYSVTSDGKIIAIVGGIENSGDRPLEGDKDYIYSIKEKSWYGWPDFSGGDPVTSPRFIKGKEANTFIIKNHPTEVVYGPIYQHKSIDALEGLAIDIDGKCLSKDTIVFADNKEKVLYAMNGEGVAKSIIILSEGSEVKSIRYHKDSMYILDSGIGCIYKLRNGNNLSVFNLPKIIWVFLIIFIIAIVLIVMIKFKGKKIG